MPAANREKAIEMRRAIMVWITLMPAPERTKAMTQWLKEAERKNLFERNSHGGVPSW